MDLELEIVHLLPFSAYFCRQKIDKIGKLFPNILTLPKLIL